MAISSSRFSLAEAMDKIWFHKNILFFQPSNLKILSMLQKDIKIFESTTSSEDGSSSYEPVVSKNKKKIVQKMKKHERLNVLTNQLSSEEKITQPTVLRIQKIRRSHWSFYELENYAFNGFSDLGFVSSEENFNGEHRKFEGRKEEEERKPYLTEAWFINRAASPLLNLRRLPKTVEGTDMKIYLRFWAQRVASLVSHELYL